MLKRLPRIRFALILPVVLAMILSVVLAGVPRAGAQSETETPSPTPTETPTNSPTPPGSAALGITSVQPGTILNDAEVEIIVTGTGFVNGSVVVVSSFGGLQTAFVSNSVLRALVPAGLPPGQYTVGVVNPDAATAQLPGALNVTAPAGPTATPDPSRTPEPTPFVRPVLVVQSYGASTPQLVPGQNLDFEMTLVNAGQAAATNILATFVSGDLVPRETGGVRALGTLAPGETIRFWQPLFASPDLRGKTTAVLLVKTTYTDVTGQSYESNFELTFPVVPQAGEGVAPTETPTPTPTPTAGPPLRPQLIVTTYNTEPIQLEPGMQFELTITVANEGDANARSISMIIGGGSAGPAGGSGTPEAGGLSGAGGEFGEFAPIGTSNVSRLGDLAVGESRSASQLLVVNTTTKPGAYPMKVSFVYTDNLGNNYVDDQVITLLVFERPQVEMDFYTAPPPLFVDQQGSLPLQLVNTGRNAVVFGNFSVNAPDSELSNNAVFVGALESGGFFPLDALITPFQAGPLELLLSVTYTNDFNQPSVITDTLTVEVLEAPPVEPFEPGVGPGEGEGSGSPDGSGSTTEETLGRRIWRFILGLLGLGSAPRQAQPEQPVMPNEFVEPSGPVEIIVPGG